MTHGEGGDLAVERIQQTISLVVLSGVRSERDWKMHLNQGHRVEGQSPYTVFVFSSATAAVQFAIQVVASTIDSIRASVVTGDDESFADQPTLRARGVLGLDTAETGQVVVGLATQELVRQAIPDIRSFDNLGTFDGGPALSSQRFFLVRYPGLRTSRRALRTQSHQRSTPFLGRTRELESLANLVERSRLVTVIGLPGSGKSALVREYAGDKSESFPDGIFSFDLSIPTSSEVVLPHFARILDIKSREDLSLEEVLLRRLENSSALLIFDGVEQHLSEIQRIVPMVLDRCPNVAVLAVGQKSLGLMAEAKFRLSGLQTPISVEGLSAVRESEAVSLFTERAQLVAADFQVDKQNSEAVATLVDALDGHPLAIELAASKAATLSPSQLVDRLGDRLTLLRMVGGAAGGPGSLLGSLDHGFLGLSQSAQNCLQRLSQFVGPFGLRATEEMMLGDLDELATIDALEELLDGGWMLARGEIAGQRFFRLPTTVRIFARQKLKGGPGFVKVSEQYSQWLSKFLGEASRGLASDGLAGWVELVDAHYGDILDRLERLMGSTADPEPAAELVLSLFSLWYFRGSFKEGRRWTQKILTKSGALDSRLVERLYTRASLFACLMNENAEAKRMAKIALRSALERGDSESAANAWAARGYNSIEVSRFRTALRAYRMAILAIPPDNLERRLTYCHNIAAILSELGRREECFDVLIQAERLAAATGYGFSRLEGLGNQIRASSESRAGNWSECRRLCFICIQSHDRLGDAKGLAQVFRLLAFTAIGEGDPTLACQYVGVARGLMAESVVPVTRREEAFEREVTHRIAEAISEDVMNQEIGLATMQFKQIIREIITTGSKY